MTSIMKHIKLFEEHSKKKSKKEQEEDDVKMSTIIVTAVANSATLDMGESSNDGKIIDEGRTPEYINSSFLKRCQTCKFWNEVGRYRSGQGLCKFMEKRIHLIWDKNGKGDEPSRDVKKQSLIINFSAEREEEHVPKGEETTDYIHRHAWIWTDKDFGCVKHEDK